MTASRLRGAPYRDADYPLRVPESQTMAPNTPTASSFLYSGTLGRHLRVTSANIASPNDAHDLLSMVLWFKNGDMEMIVDWRVRCGGFGLVMWKGFRSADLVQEQLDRSIRTAGLCSHVLEYDVLGRVSQWRTRMLDGTTSSSYARRHQGLASPGYHAKRLVRVQPWGNHVVRYRKLFRKIFQKVQIHSVVLFVT
jgi:hypothetical protein